MQTQRGQPDITAMSTQAVADRGERLGHAAIAITRAQHNRGAARTLAGGVRYLEPALIPVAAGVWLYALLAFVTG
jgi:hypothetical protein